MGLVFQSLEYVMLASMRLEFADVEAFAGLRPSSGVKDTTLCKVVTGCSVDDDAAAVRTVREKLLHLRDKYVTRRYSLASYEIDSLD